MRRIPMAEELRKRNTDCVYFLASPLTCKKGFECEYRHSEIARLNPRDCYYWLAGNCLNAACGFRHPPMDNPAGKVFDSSQSSSVPVNKTNIPCYFYFNGFCSKGDMCTFLHGNDFTVAARPTKTGNNTSSSEDKIASSYKKVAGPTIDATFQRESHRQPSAEKVSHQSACAKIKLPECEKVAVDESVSLPPDEGSNDSRSNVHIFADQSYEEPMADRSEEENPLESSPGFDVVVDHESENLDSNDDSEYPLSVNLEQRELDTELRRDNFEDSITYEPMHSDLELLYEREMHPYDHLEHERVVFTDRNVVSCCSNGELIKTMLSQKRKLTLMNRDSEESTRADLRSYVQRDSDSGNSSIIGLSRRRKGSSRGTSRNFANHPPLGRKPAVQVGKISRSRPENSIFSNSISRYGSSKHSRQYRSRRYYDECRTTRQQHPISDVSRRPVSKEFVIRDHPFSDMSRRPVSKKSIIRDRPFSHMSKRPVSREPVTRDHRVNLKSFPFKGPKTLSQIKEDKRKVEENIDFPTKKRRRSIGCALSSTDFRGPKTLGDILKDKRKVGELG